MIDNTCNDQFNLMVKRGEWRWFLIIWWPCNTSTHGSGGQHEVVEQPRMCSDDSIAITQINDAVKLGLGSLQVEKGHLRKYPFKR